MSTIGPEMPLQSLIPPGADCTPPSCGARSASPADERAEVFSIAVSSSRDLFANFERMRREIDELFGDVFERQTGLRGRGFSPSVDVFYADDPPRAVVKADLAGIDIADVALEIRGRQLLIAGERRPAEAAGRVYQQIEIEHGPFRRLVELGAEVVAGEARASYEDGILEVEIPLARRDESARRVPIEDPGP